MRHGAPLHHERAARNDHCRHAVGGSIALYNHTLQMEFECGVQANRGPNGASAIAGFQLPPYNNGSREAYDAAGIADECDLAGDNGFVKAHRTRQSVRACRQPELNHDTSQAIRAQSIHDVIKGDATITSDL